MFIFFMAEPAAKKGRLALATDRYKNAHAMFYKVIKDLDNEVTMETCFTNSGHVTRLIAWIEEKSITPSSKKTYLVALKQLLLEHKVESFEEPLLEKIRNHRDAASTEEAKNKLDPKEDDHWMKWEDVLLISNHLLQLIAGSFRMDYKLRQQYLLLQMYIRHPPLRLNYGCVMLYPTEMPEDHLNYIYKADGHYCHIGHDKVARHHGSFEFKLDKGIVYMIEEMQKDFGERLYLITKHRNRSEPLVAAHSKEKTDDDKQLYNLFLASIPTCENKPSGLNSFILRSSYVSHFMKTPRSLEELTELATKMRTSVAQLQLYYNKVFRANGDRIY